MPSADPVALHRRRVLLPWRIAFTLYTIPLMIGLHWPRLHLGVGDIPAPDKIVHFFAFAGFTFLLWSTGWIRNLLVLWIVTLIASYTSELTQSLPILGRTFSWFDITSEWFGASSVVLWLWAFAPVGGEHNRMRLCMSGFVVRQLFTQLRTWMMAGAAGAIMGIVIGVCTGLLLWWYNPIEPLLAIMGGIVGTMAGGVAGAISMIDSLARRHRESIADQRPCFSCGSSCTEANVDEDGSGICSQCGNRFHLGQWLMRSDLPRTTVAARSMRAGWLALSLGLGAVGVYILLILTHLHLPDAVRSLFLARGMPRDMRLLIDLVIASTILALAVRRFRHDVAKVIDRQATTCRVCGYDVRATPTEHGLGRCGECGTVFVRPE